MNITCTDNIVVIILVRGAWLLSGRVLDQIEGVRVRASLALHTVFEQDTLSSA